MTQKCGNHYLATASTTWASRTALDSSDDEESDDDDASFTEVAAVRYDPEIPRSRSLQKKRRQRFAKRCAGHCKDILARLLTNLDATCDDRSVAFVAERLPPLAPEKGDPATITATTRVHCVERRDARLVPGEAGVLLYHALTTRRVTGVNLSRVWSLRRRTRRRSKLYWRRTRRGPCSSATCRILLMMIGSPLLLRWLPGCSLVVSASWDDEAGGSLESRSAADG